MLIDCDTCAGRGRSCGECVVSLLLEHSTAPAAHRHDEPRLDPAAILEQPPGGFDAATRRAIAVLLDASLVAQLPAEAEQRQEQRQEHGRPATLFGIDSVRQAS
ncbi:hypothetical protein [Fodinicola acaciae]|uniref:hypothetical protein n=1 Tax=Fodinicola acaciae TaxID=2681555 RepID=UPI001651ECE0|nr:hypothetical protein [Fodinicola acaciae]